LLCEWYLTDYGIQEESDEDAELTNAATQNHLKAQVRNLAKQCDIERARNNALEVRLKLIEDTAAKRACLEADKMEGTNMIKSDSEIHI
jgi:hypothetical protein